MSLLAELREANRQWRTDDARWWAEALGIVLALGLFMRASVHVWVALVQDDVDPHLGDRDVTLQSPIADLRNHPWVDLRARVATAGIGIAAWLIFSTETSAIWLWYALNLSVCVMDPLAFAVLRLRGMASASSTETAT